MKKDRIQYLDYAKGLGILFVTFGHVVTKEIFFRNWFYSFHMPLFLIISGIIIGMKFTHFNINEWKVKERILYILKVYLISAIFLTIVLYLETLLGIISPKDTFIDNVKNILLLFGVKTTWYLPCLAIALMIFYFLRKHILENDNFFLIAFAIFLLPFVFNKIDYPEIIILYRSLIAVFFIVIGYLMANYISKFNPSFLVIIILFLLNLGFSYCMGPVDLWSLSLPEPMLYLCASLTGSFALIFLFKKVENKNIKLKPLAFVGKNSLIYFTTHIVFIYILRYFYFRLFNDSFFTNELIYGIIITLLVILLQSFFILIFSKIKLERKK